VLSLFLSDFPRTESGTLIISDLLALSCMAAAFAAAAGAAAGTAAAARAAEHSAEDAHVPYQAVIFDLDGTLLDTESLSGKQLCLQASNMMHITCTWISMCSQNYMHANTYV